MQIIVAAIFERFRLYIEAELKEVLGDSELPFYQMMRYHLGWIESDGQPIRGSVSGKQLRPTLCLLICEACGKDFRDALPAAAALELVHNFSLVHDDIEDNSLERRHRSTVWNIWGEPQAINTGDGMHVMARLASVRLKRKFSSDKVLSVIESLDKACLSLCEGQYLDISFESREQVAVEEYLSMISGKTAALLSSSCEIGALLGTDDTATIAAFAGFGRKLGLAFQIQDDILGIWGEEEKTGKSNQGDIEQRKKTLPVVYTMENGSTAARNSLIRLYSSPPVETNDKKLVIDILESSRARQYSEDLANRFLDEALKELRSVKVDSSSKQSLIDLVGFVLQRES